MRIADGTAFSRMTFFEIICYGITCYLMTSFGIRCDSVPGFYLSEQSG